LRLDEAERAEGVLADRLAHCEREWPRREARTEVEGETLTHDTGNPIRAPLYDHERLTRVDLILGL